MAVAGISMVKDEADVIGRSVLNMAEQSDFVIVADNGSTDGTRDLLADLARGYDVTIIDDPDPAYRQSEKMTRLAHLAGERGATWIVPFDADELWRGVGHIASVLKCGDFVPRPYAVASAKIFDHVATGIDPALDDPVARIQWRRPDPLPLPKVACRYREDLVIRQGNHSAGYSVEPAVVSDVLSIHHFPYRSAEQLIRKVRNGAAAYAAAPDLPADFGAHWRAWGRMTDEQIGELFRKWYWRNDPTLPLTIDSEHQPPLVHDPWRR